MPRMEETEYTTYIFADVIETANAAYLSELNRLHVQNCLAGYARDKVNLPYNPVEPHSFTMAHEYMRGAMEALKYLLATHEAARTSIQELENLQVIRGG